MEDINDVILNFKTVCKSIKAPSNFLELKLGFLNIFNLEDKTSFRFYYILDEKDNNKTYIKDDNSYEEFINNLKNGKNLTIFINELNEDSECNIFDHKDIQKEIESIKELLIKEEEINKKLKIDNDKYKEEMSKLEVEINKEEENKKEYNLNKGKYLEEIKKKEEIISENKEKINELKDLLLDKKNEKVNLEKQNDIIKNEIEEKTDKIKQNKDNKSDQIKSNLNVNNDLQKKINETEKEAEKIRLKIEEEIENKKILENKTNLLKDKIKKINKDKINYKKIHPLTKNKSKKEHQYSKTQLLENRYNNSSILSSEVIHQLENSQIIYKSKILKRKNFINELSKNINIESKFNESFDKFNKKPKNLNKVSLEEEDFKQIIKDKYKTINSNRAQKLNNEIKEMLLKNKKIKESEEKLDIINNEIELSKSQILNLKHTNEELKNEYAQISNEEKYDYSTFEKSQKIDISKIFKQIDEKTKKVEESKAELSNVINTEKSYEIKIDRIKEEIDIKKKKEDDLKKIKINCQQLESKLKGDMILCKENIQKKLKDEFEQKLKQKMKELSIDMSNKIKNVQLENRNIFLQKYEQSQIKLKEKFSQISLMAKSKINNNNNNNNNNNKIVCKTVHKGIKCQKCFQEPIIGYRYKCAFCSDYNLCEQCEEKNFLNNEHPHEFIKIRKERNEIEQNLISNINFSSHKFNNQNNINPNFGNIDNFDNLNNIDGINPNNDFNNMNNLNNFPKNIKYLSKQNNSNNNNIFNNNNNNNNSNNNNNNNNQNNISNLNINISNNNLKINNGKYSYKSYSENIQCYCNQGENSITLSISLENNGLNQWVNQNTYLIAIPNNYNIKCQNIMLNPQLPNVCDTYKFTLSNLNGLNIGEYKISYRFVVNGNSYGKDLDISIYIINRNNYSEQKAN